MPPVGTAKHSSFISCPQIKSISRAEWSRSYVMDAHVEGFVHDDPGDGFLAARLSHRAVIGDVVAGSWQQFVHRQMTNGRFLAWTRATSVRISATELN